MVRTWVWPHLYTRLRDAHTPIASTILGARQLLSIPSKRYYRLSSHDLTYRRIAQEIYLNLAKHGFLERLEKEQTFCEGCNK